MKLKFCNCRQCKAARDSKRGQYTIIHGKRKERRNTKIALRRGDENPPTAFSVPYIG